MGTLLLSLPNELLLHIVHYLNAPSQPTTKFTVRLPTPSSLYNLLLTNKRLCELSLPVLYREIHVSHNLARAPEDENCLRRYERLVKGVEKHGNFVKLLVVDASAHFEKKERERYFEEVSQHAQGVANVLGHCGALENLTISGGGGVEAQAARSVEPHTSPYWEKVADATSSWWRRVLESLHLHQTLYSFTISASAYDLSEAPPLASITKLQLLDSPILQNDIPPTVFPNVSTLLYNSVSTNSFDPRFYMHLLPHLKTFQSPTGQISPLLNFAEILHRGTNLERLRTHYHVNNTMEAMSPAVSTPRSNKPNKPIEYLHLEFYIAMAYCDYLWDAFHNVQAILQINGRPIKELVICLRSVRVSRYAKPTWNEKAIRRRLKVEYEFEKVAEIFRFELI